MNTYTFPLSAPDNLAAVIAKLNEYLPPEPSTSPGQYPVPANLPIASYTLLVIDGSAIVSTLKTLTSTKQKAIANLAKAA